MLLKPVVVAFVALNILLASAAQKLRGKTLANHERTPGKHTLSDVVRLSSWVIKLLDSPMKILTKPAVHLSPDADQKRDAVPETPAMAYAGNLT